MAQLVGAAPRTPHGSPAGGAPLPGPPGRAGAAEVVRELLAVPGSAYACVDAGPGRAATASAGTPVGESAAVVDWFRAAGPLFGGGLEDAVLTTRHHYHLVGRVTGGGGAPLALYLALRRPAANLASARRDFRACLHRPLAGAPDPPTVPAPVARRAPEPPPVPSPRSPSPHPPLPRRAVGSALPGPRSPAVARPAQDGGWGQDIGVLRRLLAGLERLV